MTAAKAMTISAIKLFTGKRAGAATLSIYAHDAATNMPTTIRSGKGSFNQRVMESWQGAELPTPVSLQQGEIYWIVWENPNGSRTNWSTASNGTIHYRGLINGVWNGPQQGWGPRAVKFRLFCPYKTGKVQVYGTGQADSSGIIPTIELDGWPSIGNSLQLILDRAKPSAPSFLAVGIPLTLPFPPVGTLYTTGIVSQSLTTSPGRSAGQGTAIFEMPIPNAPGLIGLSLGFQYLVIDSLTPLRIGHTDGIAITIN